MPASIFAGSKVKTLKSTLSLNGGADIISSTTNPQTSAVSAEPGSLLLNTTSGTMYRKLDSGSTTNWVEVGAGTGGKNYIKNPDFDGGATTNWSLQKVSLSSFIPTGNIGAADAGHSISTSSSNPLEGANSLLVQGASAFTAGNCLVSKEFTIDREDVAKVMGWSFAYEAVTANMDFSGTTANTWAVYIAEVTTGTPDTVVSWIQPAGVYNLVQGSGVGLASGTFQTTATESSAYRIVLVCINSEAAATTLKVDDFQLGPQKVVYGSPVTDRTVYTPTLSNAGTTSTNTAYWWRIGDSIGVQGSIIFDGAGSASRIRVRIPSQFNADTNKLATSNSGTVGNFYAQIGGVIANGSVIVGTTASEFEFIPDGGAGPYLGSQLVSGSELRYTFIVPAAGLSSSVQMSNDTDTRVVAFKANGAGGAVTANVTNIPTTTTSLDTHGAWNGSVFTVPVSGNYQIFGGAAGPSDASFFAYIDGVESTEVKVANGTNANGALSGLLHNLKAGQLVSIRSNVSQTLTAFFVAMTRVSGPATIAASETVAASYGTTAGTTLGAAASTIIPFAIKNYDSHSAFSGSTYTVPVSGKYRYTLSAYTDGTTNVTADFQLKLKKNSVVTKGGNFPKSGADGTPLAGVMSVTIQCNAGDQLQAEIYNGTSGDVNLIANDTYNWFCIERVGN